MRRGFTQFFAMFHKDLKLVYRNPTAFGLLVLMPFLLIAVVSSAFRPIFEGAASFDVPAVDLDGSAQSEELLAELDGLPALEVKPRDWSGTAFTATDAGDVFDEGRENFVVLVIPTGFGAGMEAGDPPELTMYADPVQEGFSSIILEQLKKELFVGGLVASFGRVLQEEGGLSEEQAADAVRREIEPLIDDPVLTVDEEFVSDQTALPSNFEHTVPGFSVMFSFWLAAIIAASVYVEKNAYRTWNRTLVAPLPRWAIMASRMLAYVLLGVAQMTSLFLLGWAVFGMDLGGDLPGLLLILGTMALVTTSFGFLISGLFKNITLMNMTTNLLVLVLAAIGGAIVPTFFLPGWAQALSKFTPHYWAIDAIQHIIILGDGLVDVLPQIGVLFAFAAVFFVAGLYRFRFND